MPQSNCCMHTRRRRSPPPDRLVVRPMAAA